MVEIVTAFFGYLDQIIVGSAVLGFVSHNLICAVRRIPDALNNAFLKSFSAASIPNGLAFLMCAFFPEFTSKIQGATFAFALAGMALITVSAKDLFKAASAAN
ncbi:hypothetical protein [Pseudomonas asplenii]|uniref:hypothetical protein n=1 Tax=Pseudomonas asplenii TaxID=53407 RepID=UPI0012FE2A2B|nr:hypothetical protein [Pseudomonas asplenii]